MTGECLCRSDDAAKRCAVGLRHCPRGQRPNRENVKRGRRGSGKSQGTKDGKRWRARETFLVTLLDEKRSVGKNTITYVLWGEKAQTVGKVASKSHPLTDE